MALGEGEGGAARKVLRRGENIPRNDCQQRNGEANASSKKTWRVMKTLSAINNSQTEAHGTERPEGPAQDVSGIAGHIPAANIPQQRSLEHARA